MVVGVCGFGYSGSGAILDLLKEYGECSIANETEFEILYCPGGIINLDYNLMKCNNRFHSSDIALTQFKKIINVSRRKNTPFNCLTQGKFYDISMEYFEKICQCSWKGAVSYDLYMCSGLELRWRYTILRRIAKIFGLKRADKLGVHFLRDMYLSIKPENFLLETQKYIEQIIASTGFDKNKICVLNQPFASNNVIQSFKYFTNPKAIIIDRDPRDVYIFAKIFAKESALFIPTDSVYTFIDYFKIMRRNNEYDEDRILRIKFEDMIYNYDSTVRKIEIFIGIKEHIHPKIFFNPQESASNVQLFRKYTMVKDEIKIIEEELAEYLYRFDEKISIDMKSIPFDA